LTLAVFDRLQRRAFTEQIPTGPNRFPDDRDDVHDISTQNGQRFGEGDRVRIVAWVMKAKFSNDKPRPRGKNGEHVNCNHSGEEFNDIHIALASNKNDGECETITAEMSPHSRPEQWTPANLVNLQFPVRVTGQLFYDSIHRPCENGRGSPKRRSSWEIHPVYAVEVCAKKSIAQCPVNGGADIWTPLVQFILDEEEEDAHEDDGE
jgi:hypothetical protein